MKTEKEIKLPPIWLCIVLDLLGCVSYFVPTWGEWIDLIWAPISAFFFFLLFGGKTGALGAAINFIEESIPFADLLPMFTIGYFVRKREIKKLKSDTPKLKE